MAVRSSSVAGKKPSTSPPNVSEIAIRLNSIAGVTKVERDMGRLITTPSKSVALVEHIIDEVLQVVFQRILVQHPPAVLDAFAHINRIGLYSGKAVR